MIPRFYAVDAEGTRWTLAAETIDAAITEVEGTYFLRKIAKRIEAVVTETVWRFNEAAD